MIQYVYRVRQEERGKNMARNFKKEAEWEKGKYKRYQYRCPKEKAKKLDDKMKKEGIGFSDLARDSIDIFLS